MKKLLMLLGIISLLFATPTLKVTLNDGGGSYRGNAEMGFVCDGQKIPLSCSGGVCTSTTWFDSSDRCFDKTDGYFEFKTDRNTSIKQSSKYYLYDQSTVDGRNDFDRYDINLGLDGRLEETYTSSGCCAGTILLGLVGIGVYRRLNY